MKKCLFEGVFDSVHCHADSHHHGHHADSHHHGHHAGHHNHHHHNHHHHHRAFNLFMEIVGPKWRQVEQVMGQLHCPELSHTQLQVIRAEVALLCSNKHHKHSVKHALHHFYHEFGAHHVVMHNPYVLFGPIVAQKIKHLKLEMCRLKTKLIHKSDSMSQIHLFKESFLLAYDCLGNKMSALHSADLTVKELEHIKHQVEKVSEMISHGKEAFYNCVGGFGKHIDPKIISMAEGLKMQWHALKEMLHHKEMEIARA